MAYKDAIKEIRNIDCEEHCKGQVKTIPHAGCFSCRAGAAIDSLELISGMRICIDDRMIMSPAEAIAEIRGEECKEICKGKAIPNEGCSLCRWGVSIMALERRIFESVCPICGEDLLGNEIRINDTVEFSVDKERVQGVIQSSTKGGMIKINCLIGEFRRKPESVVKIL